MIIILSSAPLRLSAGRRAPWSPRVTARRAAGSGVWAMGWARARALAAALALHNMKVCEGREATERCRRDAHAVAALSFDLCMLNRLNDTVRILARAHAALELL